MAAVKSDEDIKDSIHMMPEFLINKKLQAATDAKHDLGDSFTGIYKEREGITKIGTPYDPFVALKPTGWDIVDSVLETKIDIPKDTPPPKDQIDSPRTNIPAIITKFSKYEYKLTTMNINDNTSAITLFDFLKEEDQTELCLILDATMGPFQKIFEKMEAVDVGGTKKKIYYIVNRETISDPAGKPNEKDVNFRDDRNKKRKVEIHIALDSSDEKVSYPKWIDPRENYRSDFFSDFTLELSPVNYGITKSVLLTFSGEDYKDESVIETSAAGKLANSKNAMMKILNRIKDNVAYLRGIIRGAGTKENHNDLRDYFVALQKKRSGDTLIALSFFDTSRTYNGNSQTFTFNEKPRFVLTHDTFNTLPISLENGADVIYTGADTVYKFKRVKEPTDFTKAFFDTYIKDKAKRDEISKFLTNQNKKFVEKETEIKGELEKALAAVKADSERPGTSTGRDQGKFVDSELNALKIKISACLQAFFKLALFRSVYMLTDVATILREINSLSASKDYDTRLKNRVDKVKEFYYTQTPKSADYDGNFPTFDKSCNNNLVYQEIKTFDTILIGQTSYINFGRKANKFTFGASPIIQNYLFKEDSITRFIDILDAIYKSPYISAGRLEKNKAPMKEILSTFLSLKPLITNEADSSVKTDDLLAAANGEIGVTDAGLEVQAVSSPSCIIPYHEGIRQRVVITADQLMDRIKVMFNTDKKAGGAQPDEKKLLELSSFILFNYMIEMNVYYEGEYNDPNLDVYGQVIPMAGKLLLHAMSFSMDPLSLILFFMRMVYYANDKVSFEKNYKEGYFLPSIFETVLSNAFGPEFLEGFQEFSVTYFPKVLKHPRLRSLVPPMLEMTHPKWSTVENDMKMKIRQITRNLHEQSLARPVSPGKRVRNWGINDREEVAAIGGRYKKTRKTTKRKAAKSRRHKK
jgi:hypothetical protein